MHTQKELLVPLFSRVPAKNEVFYF